ncbi:hypothetical protein F5B22DRAFT_420885 [Xylaria bambusicola]|uniref:uncharacterized protein n=1 Tax=Xylaria bambusicola TaxID=326684 RepID=UPI0020089EC8|nr:uncharacterized protein F5B22DRAFT_420885 [Xylaria bambusicola]KAI0523857.1 hypothetical protein F5B22DRAFT_420885 [Xylaria bambusicola]
MASRNNLKIGQCYCMSGRQRYGTKYSAAIPWRGGPEPLPAPPMHSSSLASPSSLSPDLAMDDAGPLENLLHGDALDFSQDDTDVEEEDDDDSDDVDEDDVTDDSDSEDGVIPRIAPWRLNLTALSQRYNMYAVAYKNKVHITRIHSCVDHIVHTRPDLVLEPPASPEALNVGGYINPQMPHQMNHLIMGDLGNEEILLLAFDDGDVIGYYNFQIEQALLRIESGDALKESTSMKPFFHQNTGISTWGLAIHAQSRLIAAGNNRNEVHLFAFALTNHETPSELLTPGEDKFHRSLRNKLETTPGVLDRDLDAQQNRRDLYHHIVFEIPEGDNIPNVAFSGDADGNADKVLAIDIRGQLWILDIWSSRCECIKGLYETYALSDQIRNPAAFTWAQLTIPRGWGVLVLPQSSFLPTNGFRDSLGLDPKEANYVYHEEYGRYIGIENAATHIKNNSSIHPWVKNGLQAEHLPHIWPHMPSSRDKWYDAVKDRRQGWNATYDSVADSSLEPAFLYQHDTDDITSKFQKASLSDGSTVMRTYETSIEFVGTDRDVGIMFANAIDQIKPREGSVQGLHFPSARLAHTIHVPELSLVVAGSMCGRVALITLTRPLDSNYSFKRGFKVEAILPLKTDEERWLRPISPLLGIAVGPIPGLTLGARRYRIIIQYYDHRILAYEVGRNNSTDELSVI